MYKKKILLVDDDVNLTRLLGQRLQAHGHKVTIAHDGKEGLKKAKAKPDLIILDVVMPGMNGYEVCKKLRQDKKTRKIPIIMLTGKDAPDEKIEGLFDGADNYITKPFITEVLMAHIEATFRRSKSSKD